MNERDLTVSRKNRDEREQIALIYKVSHCSIRLAF